MRNHTCLLDHHQRSHYDTITIGPEGMMNWVLQLINSQKVKLFDSHEEKFNTQRSPKQPNQSQNNLWSIRATWGHAKCVCCLKIDEKGFHEKLCASDGSGKPDNLSENIRVEQIHDGSGQLDECNSSSAHKEKMLLQNIVTLHHLTRTTSSTVQSAMRTLTSTFQAYRILQWNNYMASAFENWFRKSRTTRIGTLFIETYNKDNHSIPSAKNQRKWFMKLGTPNCVNYSIWNPKHSAKYVHHVGTWASSIARADTSCETEQRRTRNSSSTPWISSRFQITT